MTLEDIEVMFMIDCRWGFWFRYGSWVWSDWEGRRDY